MQAFLQWFTSPINDAITIVVIILLYTMLILLIKPMFPADEQLLDFLFLLLVLCTVAPYVLKSFVLIQQFIQSIMTIFVAIVPVMSVMFITAGQLLSVVAWQPIGMFFIQGLTWLVSTCCIPLLLIAVVLDVSTRLLPEISFQKASQFIRMVVVNSIAGTVLLISSLLTFSGVLFVSAGQAVTSPIKKIIEQNIPIVGTVLVESFSILQKFQAGTATFTSMAIVGVVIVSSFQPTFILLLQAFTLKLLAACVEPFSPGRVSDLLDDFSKTLFVVTAIAAILAFSVVILLIILLLILQLGMRTT